ncbi:MAG: hypothetical protein WDM77_15115 [Steroidobacteraceae bacterium]
MRIPGVPGVAHGEPSVLEIASFNAATTEEFYAEVRRIDWTRHVGPQATLACDFSGQHPQITHTHFGALKLKDAICDGLRALGRLSTGCAA